MKQCDCGGMPMIISVEIQEDDEGKYTFEQYFIECNRCHKATPELQFTEEDAEKIWDNEVANIPKYVLEGKR